MQGMAWNAVAELAASQHGCFTRSQAAPHGVDHRRISTALRSGRIAARGSNVFIFTGHPYTFRTALRAATLLGGGSHASHRAAAFALRFDCFDDPARVPVEVSVPAPRSLLTPDGFEVIVHRPTPLEPIDLVAADGIPCTSKYRTLVDLGAVVDHDTVFRALIGAHREGLSLPVLHRVATRLHRPGQAGSGMILRQLDALARAGSVPESWLEEVLRRMLDHPELPPLISQYELKAKGGKVVARFDHAFPSIKLAVEGHSRKFHFGPIKEEYDASRDMEVARRGWQTVYLGWFAKERPAAVVAAIADIVRERQPLAA